MSLSKVRLISGRLPRVWADHKSWPACQPRASHPQRSGISCLHHLSDRQLIENQDHKSHHHPHSLTKSDPSEHKQAYAGRYGTGSVPKFRLPSKGIDAQSAYQVIHDELTLDGTPLLNLASFVHTWMPKEADLLMQENMSKNLIDQDEYPMYVCIYIVLPSAR